MCDVYSNNIIRRVLYTYQFPILSPVYDRQGVAPKFTLKADGDC